MSPDHSPHGHSLCRTVPVSRAVAIEDAGRALSPRDRGVRSGVSQRTAAASGGSVLFTVVHEGSGAWRDADGASGLMC